MNDSDSYPNKKKTDVKEADSKESQKEKAEMRLDLFDVG